MVALLGGAQVVAAAARAALAGEDAQWAMELADRLLALDADDEGAIAVKAEAMRRLADATPNAPMRNYYLASASELEGTGSPLDR